MFFFIFAITLLKTIMLYLKCDNKQFLLLKYWSLMWNHGICNTAKHHSVKWENECRVQHGNHGFYVVELILMAQHKTVVTPRLPQWSYRSLMFINWYAVCWHQPVVPSTWLPMAQHRLYPHITVLLVSPVNLLHTANKMKAPSPTSHQLTMAVNSLGNRQDKEDMVLCLDRMNLRNKYNGMTNAETGEQSQCEAL